MKLKLALIGAGGRGIGAIGNELLQHDMGAKIEIIVEPNDEKRIYAQKLHNVSDEMVFSNEDDFYKLGKVVDGVIIANQDKDHFYSAMNCVELGYDILLEKPMTPTKDELMTLYRKSIENDCRIMVTHVLRYTPFFTKLKQLVDEEVVGELVGIDHTENIANHHMAHSYVRGHWRNNNTSGPIVLTKASHDMDIIGWLANSKYKQIYSTGNLYYFKEENAPEGSAEKCCDCKYNMTCNYDAKRIYIDNLPGGWVQYLTVEKDKEKIIDYINNSNFGRCVYKQDNNVCDHQVSSMTFENGVTATFTLTAFTNTGRRETRIFGTKGTIIGDSTANVIKIIPFTCNESDDQNITTINPHVVLSGHDGGDKLLVMDFIEFIKDKNYQPKTSIADSIPSHLMSYDAELSRTTGKVIFSDPELNY